MEIFYLPPVLVALILLAIDFLAIMLLRLLFEGKFYFGPFKTYSIGDSILLPIFGFFTAIIIQTNPPMEYNSNLQIGCLLVGYGVLLITELINTKKKILSLRDQFFK